MDIIKKLRAVAKTRMLSATEYRAFVTGNATELTPSELRSLHPSAPQPPKVITPAAPRKAAVITAVTTETKREQMRKRLALTSL
jgi:hypothetical protein